MKRPYEKPVVMKLQSRLMNKFGAGTATHRRVRKSIEGVRVNDLVEQYGSPLFVYSERALRRRFHQLRTAFTTWSALMPKASSAWGFR